MKKQFKKKIVKEPKEFDEEVIKIDRVTRVVKGGRRLRFRALVVIGNKKGKVGVGIGKSTEVSAAIKKGINAAKKNLIEIPIHQETIPHETKVKFKSSELLLMPAKQGTGIIAGGPVRKLIALSGVKNILGKSYGSNNKINVTKAAYAALKTLSAVSAPVSTPKKVVKTLEKETSKPKTKTAVAKKLSKKTEEKTDPKNN
jgi:small subunit ribosomal protein S5